MPPLLGEPILRESRLSGRRSAPGQAMLGTQREGPSGAAEEGAWAAPPHICPALGHAELLAFYGGEKKEKMIV